MSNSIQHHRSLHDGPAAVARAARAGVLSAPCSLAHGFHSILELLLGFLVGWVYTFDVQCAEWSHNLIASVTGGHMRRGAGSLIVNRNVTASRFRVKFCQPWDWAHTQENTRKTREKQRGRRGGIKFDHCYHFKWNVVGTKMMHGYIWNR